jgi:uncharacterized protein DUF1579
MNPLLKLILMALPVAATSSCSWVTTQVIEPPQEPEAVAAQEPAMSEADMMAAMMALSIPGDEHKELMNGVGNWNTRLRMHMSQDADWIESTGTAKVQKGLGGRYLIEKASFDVMGMKTEGLLILGFDNLTQKYQSMWLDTMTTRMSYAEGVADDQGRVVMTGLMVDSITPKGRGYSHRTTIIDEDHMLVEMFDSIPAKMGDPLPDEPNVKVMEIHYTRAK